MTGNSAESRRVTTLPVWADNWPIMLVRSPLPFHKTLKALPSRLAPTRERNTDISGRASPLAIAGHWPCAPWESQLAQTAAPSRLFRLATVGTLAVPAWGDPLGMHSRLPAGDFPLPGSLSGRVIPRCLASVWTSAGHSIEIGSLLLVALLGLGATVSSLKPKPARPPRGA